MAVHMYRCDLHRSHDFERMCVIVAKNVLMLTLDSCYINPAY